MAPSPTLRQIASVSQSDYFAPVLRSSTTGKPKAKGTFDSLGFPPFCFVAQSS
jgi:hypothetical protein